MLRITKSSFSLGLLSTLTLLTSCGGGGDGGSLARIRAVDATGLNGQYVEVTNSKCSETDSQLAADFATMKIEDYLDFLQIGGGQAKFLSPTGKTCTLTILFDANVKDSTTVELQKNGKAAFVGSDCSEIPTDVRANIDGAAPNDGKIQYQKGSPVLRLYYKMKAHDFDQNDQPIVKPQDQCDPYILKQ